jgi:hypothetical protein
MYSAGSSASTSALRPLPLPMVTMEQRSSSDGGVAGAGVQGVQDLCPEAPHLPSPPQIWRDLRVYGDV